MGSDTTAPRILHLEQLRDASAVPPKHSHCTRGRPGHTACLETVKMRKLISLPSRP